MKSAFLIFSLLLMTPLVKTVTKLSGLVFLVIGVAGFFTGGMLLMFEVDTVHNVVHILSGVVALLAAGTYAHARLFLILFGLVYGVVTVIGFLTGDVLGLFYVNDADNLLHLVIAAVFLGVGLGSRKAS